VLAKESIKLELNVPAKMRDGTILYADVWRPDTGEKCPAILTRLPYIPSDDSELMTQSGYMNPQRFARAGYAVVIQDCRGTGASEGEPYFWRQEREDGYDTVEWLAAQPWCDGSVGMYGISYFGYTQWAAAVMQPPHLRTICPMGAQTNFRAHPFSERGDAFRLAAYGNFFLTLAENTLMKKNLTTEKYESLRERITYISDHWEEQIFLLPLKDSPVSKIAKELNLAPSPSEILANMQDENYWKESGDPFPYEKVNIPCLHICGWYDLVSGPGVLQSYQELRARGGSDLARRNQRLLIGPWIHTLDLQNIIGELNFGKASSGNFIDITGMHIKWFDYWLKGIDSGIMDESPVRIFVMGDNVWRNENEWPLARTKYTKYYFHSGGQSNSSLGNGFLSTELPYEEQPDVYLYDPRNPVVFNPPGLQFLLDQQDLEKRADILVYTSAPLETDLEVTGPIQIKLWGASSAVDTDFTGKLVDVWPNGKAYNLVDGLIRARYRLSVVEPSLIEPGRIYEYSITLGNTSNLFKAGHRIRVEISSSNFPRYDRNLNTGHPIGQDAEIVTALQTIYHDRKCPSYILLPVIPR
jgi:putative CocE/NonD family hydrolase